MLPEIVSQVPIRKLAPSCVSHILIRKTSLFLETPGCSITQGTRGAPDNHRNHQWAALGARLLTGNWRYLYCPLHSLTLVYNSLVLVFFLTICFIPWLILSTMQRGMIWFDALSLHVAPQTGREKKTRRHIWIHVTYQVPSYRSVFRESEKTPGSSKRVGPLQFPLIQPSQQTPLYDQANEDTLFTLYFF